MRGGRLLFLFDYYSTYYSIEVILRLGWPCVAEWIGSFGPLFLVLHSAIDCEVFWLAGFILHLVYMDLHNLDGRLIVMCMIC